MCIKHHVVATQIDQLDETNSKMHMKILSVRIITEIIKVKGHVTSHGLYSYLFKIARENKLSPLKMIISHKRIQKSI